MTDKAAWEGAVGETWASHWQQTDRSFTGLTDRLLSRASASPIRHALDVGCGAGELSLALGRGHGGAQITGVDVSDDLVTIARQRGENLANVRFEVGDASSWGPAAIPPDLIVSRHGVMFFADPVAAFGHLLSIGRKDARLVFSCFRERHENSWAERVLALLPAGLVQAPNPFAPGPFAFADPARVTKILSEAGWVDIAFEDVDFAYVVGAGEECEKQAVAHFLRIGPAAGPAAQLQDDERAGFIGRLRKLVENNRDGSIVAFRGSAWIVSARPG